MQILVPDWPAPPRIRALMTLRHGGCSASPYDGFNVADHVGDDPAAVAANRGKLRASLPAEPLWLRQVHGTRVLDAADYPISEVPEADAIRTRVHDRVCVVMTADCLPILITDHAGTQVAAIHAGWRGLAAGIVEATLETFADRTSPLMAWLGPCIGPDAFEVGPDVLQAFTGDAPESRHAFKSGETGRWLADLHALARIKLRRCGVEDIHSDAGCTYNDTDRFYSYRRDGRTGRMATLIWIEGGS
ncbi:MAG: peptidoglycan editing factor PgeF [Gammaproteobacteria bacterium]|nr:peptidoglycan editing factor PgeF [Gammaproteobacteria bacterium]